MSFLGYWEGDLKHGFGTYTYSNGDTYEGDWNNNLRHGQGTYTYASSGAKYVGGWVNGRREGTGEIILSNYSYKGNFTADQVRIQAGHTLYFEQCPVLLASWAWQVHIQCRVPAEWRLQPGKHCKSGVFCTLH